VQLRTDKAHMRIKIISADSTLRQDCYDILVPLNGKDLSIISDRADRLPHDIAIWDYSPDMAWPDASELELCRNHLFLVENLHVGAMVRKLPAGPVGLLLKPVTAATLHTFLEQAVARCGTSHPGSHSEADGAKADRDEILQFLLQANLKLQEYDHHRTNFLARAMHDFRAPLTALNGYCGLLLEGMLGALEPEQKQAIESMAQSATRLARMSSSLFALSLGREARRPLRLREYPIENCVQQAVYELAGLSSEKDISISMDLLPAPCPLFFEPTQVEQLVVNLLENACKFTPKHGSIEITGYPYFWGGRAPAAAGRPADPRAVQDVEPDAYRIDIEDSGPGIPEQYSATIFEEYTSYSGPDDRSGGGLGLAICKTIAESHRGAIWVSPGSDHTMFSFVLPLRMADTSGETPLQQTEVLAL
jgi:signal transduction histidine kinase